MLCNVFVADVPTSAVGRCWFGRRSGSALVSINEVTPGPVSTGMGDQSWVQLPVQETYLSIYNQRPMSTQPGHPSVGRRNEYISQRAAMLCGWGIKAGMVRLWVAGKTV